MKKIIILLSAVALIVAFTIPATAADEIRWNWYGNARMKTFWVSEDLQDSGTVGGGNSSEDSELDWSFQGNSRIGFRVKGGPIGGRVEFRTAADDPGDSASGAVNADFVRLWGSWNFGAGYGLPRA